jgi:hypothetical protein
MIISRSGSDGFLDKGAVSNAKTDLKSNIYGPNAYGNWGFCIAVSVEQGASSGMKLGDTNILYWEDFEVFDIDDDGRQRTDRMRSSV